MGQYRKKPVVIEAWQIGSDEDKPSWLVNDPNVTYNGHYYEIKTLEGTMHGSDGDWLIRGVSDEIYPCKPDIFAKTYEPA